MLTKWAKKCLRVYINSGNVLLPAMNNDGFGYPGLIPAVSYSGNNCYIYPYPLYPIFTSLITNISDNGKYGIAVGTDDHTESENDYSLGSHITSGISLSGTLSIQRIFDASNDIYGAYYDYPISNNTDSPITIREIGVFSSFYTAVNKGDKITRYDAQKTIMIDRTVLPEPITIPAGEARVIRYKFNYYVGD